MSGQQISPDLNPIENLWSIIDEAAYRDPIPKTMGGLKSRLRQAWQNIPLASLRELARSMLQPLKNVIQNNGGTLDIDDSTVVKGNNVHNTGKPSLLSDS